MTHICSCVLLVSLKVCWIQLLNHQTHIVTPTFNKIFSRTAILFNTKIRYRDRVLSSSHGGHREATRSQLISPNRTVPDTRDFNCKGSHYHQNLPSVSIILPFHNCHSPLPDWKVDADELATAEVMAVQRNFQKGTLDFKLLRE